MTHLTRKRALIVLYAITFPLWAIPMLFYIAGAQLYQALEEGY